MKLRIDYEYTLDFSLSYMNCIGLSLYSTFTDSVDRMAMLSQMKRRPADGDCPISGYMVILVVVMGHMGKHNIVSKYGYHQGHCRKGNTRRHLHSNITGNMFTSDDIMYAQVTIFTVDIVWLS